LEIGVVVTRVYRAIEYKGKAMFDFITEEVIKARKEATLPGPNNEPPTQQMKAKGTVAKLYGNSCYGKCLTNVEKHENIKIATDAETEAMINSPLFKKLDPISDGEY
jgi:hypothetical protein